MAATSSSSGGSFKYDVFISFRGEDTRRCFVCHLYEALKLKALDTFIDSEELRKGDDLSELLKAIQKSRLSIVVFSKNYASSTWCLKELVQILECMDRQRQIVVPVFYEVDPSHIRKRKESFAKAFAKHESDSTVDREELESWKSSLTRATNLSGHDSGNYQDDIQLIESIVEDILKKVIRISPSKTDGLVGMDTHMNKIDSLFKKIDSLFKLGVEDCRHIVGIWGMGGIGKSTIAKAVYEKYSPQFEHKCFLDNVKEGFLTKNGKVLLEDLLSRILKIKDRSTLDEGLNMMRERLGEKKILLVLDDVDKMEQIDTLIGENPSFGDGSRIIITTRDKNLLARFLVYEPELFTTEKVLELFHRYAFRTIKPSKNYDEISRRAVEYAHGLPLALKVLGALLDNKKLEEWEYELKKIKKMSITFLDDNKIGRVLWASYDGLDEWQKKIFLDIACFFRGKWEEDVTPFHESCGFSPQKELRVLEERSLVNVVSSFVGRQLEMHDLIQEMGREIVRQESTKDPGRRSRLWYYEDVLQVLAQNTPLPNLVRMDLGHSTYLIKTPDFIGATNLKELDLAGCTSLLEVHPSISALKSLVRLNLDGCSNLVNFPNISGNMMELQELHLDETSITEMPSSINDLPGLQHLNLRGCRELRSLPSSIHMKSLGYLDLSGCSKLEEFPEISEVMERLYKLHLDGTAVKELPSSINNLTGLVSLSMRNCTRLVSLPDEICYLARLGNLDLTGCSKLSKLPDNFQNWESLGEFGQSCPNHLYKLEGSGIKQLPFCISRRRESLSCKGWKDLTAPFSSWPTTCINPSCSILVHLDLSDCNLLELSDAIAHLSRLQTLRLSRNRNLESLPAAMNRLPHLRELHLEDCKRLESIPELSSSIEYISADDCTTLVTVPTLQLQCVGIISFTFLNCLKLENTNLFMDIVETATDNQDCRSIYTYFRYHMSLPGSDIPEWFNHKCGGSSVTVQLPPDWSSDKFQGFAICSISNLRGARDRKVLESAFCCATFKENDGQDNFYFPLLSKYLGGTNNPLESNHMIMEYITSSSFGNWHSGRKYTHATFRIVTRDFESIPDYSKTWKDYTWITSCGVRLFQMNAPSSVDLVCNVENRETETSSKRKRETVERGKEKMGVEVQEEEECSGGPICSCFSLSGCTMSLRKKQRETEGVAGLESEEADVSGEGGLLTLSL
ncbi:hypothetical protein ACLB2K_069068 [Fragaria x ananassa]